MMIHFVGKQAFRTFLWTAFLHFIFTTAEHVKDISPSSILQREKRAWKWNMMLVYEEKQPSDPPEIIGRLKNTLFDENNVKFKLSGDGAGDIFILSKTGEVLVLKKLDRETASSYTLKAEIIDIKSGRKLEDDTEFTIHVQDINDNGPVFSETYTGFVKERAEKGTKVLTVNATDKDDPSTPHGLIMYELLNGTNFFSINNKTGEISTKVDTLDRETQSEYKLRVKASDMFGVKNAAKQTADTVVTINIKDINDNVASFSKERYKFSVKEDEPAGFNIGRLDINDRDEKQNKNATFTIDQSQTETFDVKLNDNNDGVLILKKKLDYETKPSYNFTIKLQEHVVQPPDNTNLRSSAQILITVEDVDEPPVFTQTEYTFSVREGQKNIIVGTVSAKDTDKTSHRIRYSISLSAWPVNINSETGQLTLKNALDREAKDVHEFLVTAEEESTSRLKSSAVVKINVLDINDNDPYLDKDKVYICESDESGTIIDVIGATDKDENPGKFHFTLKGKHSNFSLHDNLNNTVSIILNHGGFSAKNPVEEHLDIEVIDGGNPPRKITRSLQLEVCVCGRERQKEYCVAYNRSGVSVSAVIAILLCILTILVIVILFVLRKRYQKEVLAAVKKPSSEIHEQLVVYDEEGGGEMDTNVYDVSILTSARSDTRLGPDPPPPAMYAVVKKPSACKGDMAVMIGVKKDEADHDRDGIPYDTLHIYGYEGSESLAGSLSSLESSSSVTSDLDYDFLNDWGPRFRTLAQIYGSEGNTSY
ncbi:cadherin-5 isoform X2 [Neoarius graeffei]|nr:cadherin-5 isoform X2 [Neoarius graeffei]